jgi:GNAT superfamily N-acetyltransferase
VQVRPLRQTDVEGGFTCGVPALDSYLAKRAWPNEQAGISRCYVLVTDAAPQHILGYYTLSTRSVEPELLASALHGRLPRFPLPVLYIGLFAVAQAEQGKGYGRVLMRDALARCAAAAEYVGATGVFLDSLDDKSTAFYSKLGFRPVGQQASPRPMFLPMTTIRQALSPPTSS